MDNNKNMTDINESDINLEALIMPYIRNWYWFLISALILFFISFLYLRYTTPIYKIISTVLIKDAKNNSNQMAMLQDLSGFSEMSTNSIDNEIQILKSKKLMYDVVKKNNLQITITTDADIRDTELYKESSPINIILVNEKLNKNSKREPLLFSLDKENNIFITVDDNPPIKTTYNKLISLPNENIIITKNKDYNREYYEGSLKVDIIPIDKRVEQLQEALDVNLINKDASVISLSMNYPEIHKAEDIINSLVSAYNEDAIKDKNSEGLKTKNFIDDRINLISKELGDVEEQKERFKSVNKISDIQTEAKINIETSAEARQKQLNIDSQLELNNQLINYLNHQNSNQILPTNIGLDNSSVSNAISTYNQLLMERNRLLQNATNQHPAVIDLTKQINEMRSSISQSLQKNKIGLQISSRDLQSEQNHLSGKISKLPALEKTYRSIDRQQQIKENLYLILLQKREENAISLVVTSDKARIIDKAYSSEKPVYPKRIVIILGALFLGIIIPFVLIYIFGLLNNKIKSKHDIEKLSNTPVFAEIPKIEKDGNDIIQINDDSPMAEAFRILITNLNFMLPKKDSGKTIFVTSTVKGEGKTHISANLALALATKTKKSILIGADIRNPQLQRYNPIGKNMKGLTEFLYDENLKVEDIINKSVYNPNLDIVYSGKIPPNPAELLGNGRMDLLISELKNKYQFIILDTAPLLLVTDTFIISYLADATVYVVRSNYTEKSLLEFANKSIESGKVKNAGYVLNDVSKNYFGYGNKYGYGYGNEKKSWYESIKIKFK